MELLTVRPPAPHRQAINGAVPMKIPIFNLGYKLVEPTAPVSILFYATLDPPLHPPAAKEDHAASSEEARLQKDVLRFMKELEKNEFTAKRRIEILVPTSNGQTAFVTRYIHPQTLPPTCSTDETAARYVTLVPFVEDSNEDGDAVDMWQTSREFLETQSGDWEVRRPRPALAHLSSNISLCRPSPPFAPASSCS